MTDNFVFWIHVPFAFLVSSPLTSGPAGWGTPAGATSPRGRRLSKRPSGIQPAKALSPRSTAGARCCGSSALPTGLVDAAQSWPLNLWRGNRPEARTNAEESHCPNTDLGIVRETQPGASGSRVTKPTKCRTWWKICGETQTPPDHLPPT